MKRLYLLLMLLLTGYPLWLSAQNDCFEDVPGSEFIVLLAILIVLMLLMGISRVLQH